jgi:hypothetical protein
VLGLYSTTFAFAWFSFFPCVIRTKETVERHEEEEEESDVVDLLAGPLEDLVQPRLKLSL